MIAARGGFYDFCLRFSTFSLFAFFLRWQRVRCVGNIGFGAGYTLATFYTTQATFKAS